MNAAVSISTRRPYGLTRVCRMWGVSRSSVYRGRRGIAPSTPRRRPGPQGPMPDVDLVEAIRGVLLASPFHGEVYRKVWARPRTGACAPPGNGGCLMRKNALSAPVQTGRPTGPRNHDCTIIPTTVDTIWDEPCRAMGPSDNGE